MRKSCQRLAVPVVGVLLASMPVDADELARWGFNEGSGTATADLSAHNGWTLSMLEAANGAYPAPKALWGPKGDTPSGTGHALQLDGVDDYASPELGPLGDMQWTFGPTAPITDFSVSAWVKPTGGRPGIILSHSDAGGYLGSCGWVWWAQKVGDRDCPQLSYRVVLPPAPENNQQDQNSLCPSGAKSARAWTHWVTTYQADDGAGGAVVKHYIDGELRATDMMKKGTLAADSWHQLCIGTSGRNDNRSRGGCYCGLIDEVRIFDEMLSPKQVELLHRNPEVEGAVVEALVRARTVASEAGKRDGSMRALKERPGYRTVKDFGAVGNGREDDTLAIQAAINYKRGSKGAKRPAVVFLPAGKYRITATLVAWDNTELAGDPGDPPTLVLPVATPGFDNPAIPKPLVVFIDGYDQAPGVLDWKSPTKKQGSTGSQFCGAIRNVNLRLEKGNPGAVGIMFQGVQNVALHNVQVVDTDSAFGGVYVAPAR